MAEDGTNIAAAAPMRIGELSERSGRTVRTLHFYEELGLLAPATRTKGGFRVYDGNALLRIHWISRLQDLGFSLPDIKDFLQALQGRSSAPEMMGDLHRFYAGKLEETHAQIRRLEALAAELRGSIEYLDTCLGCAPKTARHECPACRAANHAHTEAPALVAAVHSPSSE